MKVYVVMEQSSWDFSREDHGDDMGVCCICLTKEKAEEKIHSLVRNSRHGDEFEFERDDDGTLYAFYEDVDEDHSFWYDEMEVLE